MSDDEKDCELMRYSRVFGHISKMLSEHAGFLPAENVEVPSAVFEALEEARRDLQPVLSKLAQLGKDAAHARQSAEGWSRN